MKIRTQFIIIMILFGIILLILAVSAIITLQKVEKASQQEKLASNIAQGASELSYLSNDYLIYRESQQLKRWQSRFASFSNQVASLNVDKPEQQVLVRNIKANQQRLKQVFDSVASAVGAPSQNRSVALELAFLQVSWSRMAVQSEGLVSDATRLSQLLHRQMDQLRETRNMLMYVMVGLFGAFLLASYMLTYRRILKSIATLQAGTAVIGSGNLDFVIEKKKNDEIGDLSRAFNRMTSSLKEVTASKADLEREVTQRKEAEEDLRRQREWLQVTLSSIGDAVIATDTEGRITFLNPVAVVVTGWQLEETLGRPIQSVFWIINEKTHEPAEDLVARVLNEKRVVALANDTALVTKDGREVPIEDSAAPIKDSAGNVIGAVFVFHDVTERRRAQTALREAHDRAAWLARFPDENPNPVLRAGADGIVLYCNPASAKFPGWKCEVGQLLQNELLPLISQAMAEGKESQWDMQIEGRFYFIWIAPFPEERYANIYARDITARKQAEEALRDAQKQMEANLDAMTRLQKLGSLFVREGNLGSVLTEIVDAAIAISGGNFGNIQLLDPESFDLKIVAQRGFPKWWLDFWNSVSKGQGVCGTALECGERIIVDDVEQSPIFVDTPALEIQLKAGIRAVQSTPLVSRSGKPLGMFSTHYKTPHRPDDRTLGLLDMLARQTADIIERAQAEEALRESEQRLNRAQEIEHLGSWELDLVSNRLTWSGEAYRIFGLKPQEFAATYEAFLEAVHPDDRSAVDAAYSDSLREGRDTYEIEHRVVRKSTGEIRIVHERCEHFRDASGRIIRSVGMVHDITERKRAEEALRQRTLELQRLTETLEQQVQERTEELEEANKALRQLSIKLLSAQEEERKRIAGELHDTIGSYLGGIKFKVESAIQEIAKTPKAAAKSLNTIVPVIQEAVEECRRIQQDLRPSMLDDLGLLPTLSWFCRRFQTIYSGIHVDKEVTIEESEVPPPLKIVAFRVTQEAMNNVVKHSKANTVRLCLRKIDGRMELVVEDNGRGIDLEKIPDSKNTRPGLGFSSMRERTELSGGSFQIESTLGKGTTIRASWPI